MTPAQFSAINWGNPKLATRDLCAVVFGRTVLATHSLTGLPSNVMISQGKAVKPKLDSTKVEAICGMLYNMPLNIKCFTATDAILLLKLLSQSYIYSFIA